MQAGTTGINAMRVYNVTKQGQDQDPDGVFIRNYIPELKNVPTEYIHEPHKMSASLQKKYGLVIEGKQSSKCSDGLASFVKPIRVGDSTKTDLHEHIYPYPIVDEKATAKASKDKLSAVRKEQGTKEEAQKVYIKHGSRRNRSDDRSGLIATIKRAKIDDGQMSLLNSFKKSHSNTATEIFETAAAAGGEDSSDKDVVFITHNMTTPQKTSTTNPLSPKKQQDISSFFGKARKPDNDEAKCNTEWNCETCTYLNDKPHALACEMCSSIRN